MTEAAFLRLILADPAADGPRLIYADWLDEHGDHARAEFIRVQCALAGLPADDPRAPALRERGEVLLEHNRVAWSASLSGLATRWEFRRGFPEFVRLEARTFLARADDLFAAVPVRHVELLDVQGHLPRLGKCPHLARLTGLTINSSHIGNAVPKALAHAPHLARIARLYLRRNAIGDDGAQALAASPHLAGLTTLDLGENAVGPAGAHTLAAAPHLAGLTALRLPYNPVGPD